MKESVEEKWKKKVIFMLPYHVSIISKCLILCYYEKNVFGLLMIS